MGNLFNYHKVVISHPKATPVAGKLFFVKSMDINKNELKAILKNYLFSSEYELKIDGSNEKEAHEFPGMTKSLAEAKNYVGSIKLYRTISKFVWVVNTDNPPIVADTECIKPQSINHRDGYDGRMRTFVSFKAMSPLVNVNEESIIEYFHKSGIDLYKTKSDFNDERFYFCYGQLNAATKEGTTHWSYFGNKLKWVEKLVLID